MDKEGLDTASTKESEKAARSRLGGVSARGFFIPVIVVLAILHIIIIGLMLLMFTQSSKLSQAMQDSSACISTATSLVSGTGVLSETSTSYVLLPVTPGGEANTGPLIVYANEMAETDHRGDQVLAQLEAYQVDDEVLQAMTEAATNANGLVDLQNRAIALTSAVYPLPDIPPLAGLQLPELSAEDAALSDEEKIALAQSLMLGQERGTMKNAVTENVSSAVASLRASSGALSAQMTGTINFLRTMLITIATLIVVVLAFMFIAIYRLLTSPMRRFSRLIANDSPLDSTRGLREVRLLADSYNDLLRRRDMLEGILREAAETDALTGLPNRYSYQQHLLDIGSRGFAITVFLFDVDNLKITNDTLGHAAGDDLIKRAAKCISTCFCTKDGSSCYRFAGDEFAALIKDLDEDDISALASEFGKLQEQNNVSISWGYAHAKEIGDTTFRALMDEADQRMYQMKQKVHEGDSGDERTGALRSLA